MRERTPERRVTPERVILPESPRRNPIVISASESEEAETGSDTESDELAPVGTPRGRMQMRGSKSTSAKTPMAKAPGKSSAKQGGSNSKKAKKG